MKSLVISVVFYRFACDALQKKPKNGLVRTEVQYKLKNQCAAFYKDKYFSHLIFKFY